MTQEKTTRLLIIEEQDILRQGLETVFAKESEFDVVASVANPAEAAEHVNLFKPKIIVLGMRPDGAVAEVCATLTDRDPETKILLLAPPGHEQQIIKAFKQGASGCLLTDVMADDLIQTIRMIAKGQMVVPQAMAKKGLVERRRKRRNPPNLTIRELEILQLMADGLRNKEIAQDLRISEVTVKTHVSRILRKMGKSNRTAAIAQGHKNGWIRFNP